MDLGFVVFVGVLANLDSYSLALFACLFSSIPLASPKVLLTFFSKNGIS